ncbi:hypothetical protein C8R47DRAFT_1092872 [Mycena vitilis]|nr:hypothetical protein C8R47DRAFT_1092872 [Mycena vitilis]
MSDESLQSEELAALVSRVTLSTSLSAPAPIHRLSPEILTQILQLEEQQRAKTSSSDWPRNTSLTWRVVCSRLALVMGTPSLSGTVEVDCAAAWSTRHSDILVKVLERSAETPLTIYVRHDENTRQTKALGLLVLNCARWQEASLELNLLGMQIVNHFKENLPQLKLLRLNGHAYEFDAFETAPLLTTVCVRCLTFPAIPWSQVKTLELWGLRTLYGALSGLPHCSKLVELTVSLMANGNLTMPPRDEATTCDTVETFTLAGGNRDPYGYAAQCLEHALSTLTLPSLHTLHILPTIATWQHRAFRLFSQRSLLSNTLKFLGFEGVDIDAVDLVELLAELPSLEVLWLTDVAPSDKRPEHNTINDYLLHSLTRTADSFLVPSLKAIYMHPYAPFAANVFVDFQVATSRWDNPERTARFDIFLWLPSTVPDVDPVAVAELKAMASRQSCRFSYRKLDWA